MRCGCASPRSGAENSVVVTELAEAFRLQQAGRLAEAEAAYARLLAKTPDDAIALINAGALALARNDVVQAVARLERAVELVPANAIAQNNLGFALINAGRFADALAMLDRAVARKPDYAQAHNNRGIALSRLGQRAAAVNAFERALALDRTLADAAVNLGDAHAHAGNATAASAAYAAALTTVPGNVNAQAGHAFATALLGDLAGARAALEAVVAAHPGSASAWQTLGAVANWSWDHERAEAAFRRALALQPDHADAQFGIASTLLARGRYRDGFEAFERRPEGVLDPRARLPQFPVWDGGRLQGTLLIHGEQGLGDVVQFARFVAGARERVGRVVLLLDGYWAPLAALLASCAGVDVVATDVARLGEEVVAARISILSLPHVLGTTADDLPGPIPYLAAAPERTAAWTQRLSGLSAPRVGLAWSVLARDVHGYVTTHKSIPAAALQPLLAMPDVAFVSLQPGAAGDPAVFQAKAHRVADFRGELTDFGETAALIASLDLVISADTAVAHVAGALGVPVFLLDRYNSCWRWRLATETSPWYPTVTIFRQSRFADWSDPIRRAGARLDAWRVHRREAG
jgi:tetratricopeptide (TPR) repeat protein